jgi:dolichol-phosphate mannosyltransferase
MKSISILIPTYNEAKNIRSLIEKIEFTLKKVEWEIIFVDDNSPDNTSEVIQAISITKPNVKVIKRIKKRGLAGAILTGLSSCKFSKIVIMDADLQHDPIFINKLLDKMNKSNTKVVVGSRYVENATINNFNIIRRFGSKIMVKIFNFFSPIKLSDPMSGFFIIDKNFFLQISNKLSTNGYKILADIILNIPSNTNISQIPIDFKGRNAGESKMSFRVMWDFMLVIIHSILKKYIPREYLSYIFVGLIGLSFHVITLYLLHKKIEIDFLTSHIVATLIAILINYSLNNFLTFYVYNLSGFKWITGFIKYNVFCSYGVFISFSIAKTLTIYDFHWLIAGLLGAFTASIWNFTMSKFIIWKDN